MKPVKHILFALLLTFTASAQTYRIQDGGMSRTFVVEEIPAAAQSDEGGEVPIVLYEAGATKTEYTKRVATKQVLVEIKTGTDPSAVAEQYNIVLIDSPSYAPGFHVFETTTAFSSLTLAETLRNDPNILSAEPLLARKHKKKVIPNDPQFTNQWHLLNTGQNGGTAGIDINITNVWESYQGSNILIGIIDDGLDLDHEDLISNLNTNIDWDFNYDDGIPQAGSGDDHGSPCAGVAAGRGNNGKGISGAAPQATLVGLRLISLATSDSQEADALSHSNQLIRIKSNSWGPNDDTSLQGPGTLAAAALKAGAENEDSLFFWAGGNGLADGDNANFDGYANSIYTIAIGAVDLNGIQSWYSEPGACLVACAPSSGDSIGITTVNYTGGYRDNFGGTSSATPLVAGVGALMLEANPELGWRDMQEILIASAQKTDASDSDWTNNAAGFHFNHKYGAGMVDAEAAVELSENWNNLGVHTNLIASKTNLNQAIPDNYGGVASQTFAITNDFRAEHVTLRAEITHTYQSDIEIWLTSPSGTKNLLAYWPYANGVENLNWTFSTVRNWGESSVGDWTVDVYDNYEEDTGTVNSLTLTLYGTDDADTDGDGLQNLEEPAYGSNPYLADTDNDGMMDGDEVLAGTQPTNAASGLFIENFQPISGQLGWQSVSGKTYSIEYTTNLLSGFQTLETNLLGNPPQNVFTNLPDGAHLYFRILLETD
jgi:subtilisin-like proprotein convertase family protein